MAVTVIANPKGGVGKTTIATNLAGYLAHRGRVVMLGDIDRQQSSKAWLSLRPEAVPAILGWEVEGGLAKTPKNAQDVVLDTPAGLSGDRLKEVLKVAKRVIVPLQPSMFDILATKDFLADLAERRHVRDGDVEIGVVGMRVDVRSRAAEQLQRFVEGLGLPVLGHLRNTQNYVQLAAHGLTLWDIAPSRVEKDLEQWQSLIQFISRKSAGH